MIIKSVFLSIYYSFLIFCVVGFGITYQGNEIQAQQGGRQALMPEGLLVKTIFELKDNEEVEVEPEVMLVDFQNKCWVNKLHPISNVATGFRIKKDREGFHGIILDKNLRWIRTKIESVINIEPLRTLNIR